MEGIRDQKAEGRGSEDGDRETASGLICIFFHDSAFAFRAFNSTFYIQHSAF
jgi:hypothetical protein